MGSPAYATLMANEKKDQAEKKNPANMGKGLSLKRHLKA